MQIDDRKQQTGTCKLATQSAYSIILHLNRHCCNNKCCFENQKKNYAIPRPSQSCTWEGREEGAGDKIGFSNAIHFIKYQGMKQAVKPFLSRQHLLRI